MLPVPPTEMDLTPIRIRGKRKRTGGDNSNLQKALAASPAQARRPGGPQKPIRSSRTAEMTNPTLQHLPQELLEIIFLYSMNIALPRSSPTLGRKLSSRTVILEFVLRSFFHTVDHSTNYRDRKTTGDPFIQSQLLGCRFFTWSFFRIYVQRARQTLIEQRGDIWKDASYQPEGLEAFDGLFPFKFSKITYLGFAEGFCIPEKLLHGPWSKEKASFLFVLVSLSGELDWEGSMAGEIAKLGMEQAVDENNERAVAALAVLLGVAQMIDTGILRKAVLGGCNISIVRQLLFNAQILHHNSPKECLDFYDPVLWRWADAHEDKGVMLKDLLRKADKFSLEFYLEGEAEMRAKIVPFPYGGTKFDSRTVLDTEVIREMLVRLYLSYGRKITASPRQRRQFSIERVGEGD